MAKQNVTFIERHVEKIVLGVTGAVVLAVAGLYAVGTPNSVSSGGEALNPKTLVGRIAEQAERTRQGMKNAKPETADNDKAVPLIKGDLDVYETHKLSKETPVVLVPPGVRVPETKNGPRGTGGRIHLATVAGPRSLVGMSGRVSARLASPEIVDLRKSGGGPPAAPAGGATDAIVGVTRDIYWATVFAAVNYAEQRKLFSGAQYDSARQDLIIAAIEAERAPLLSNGEWGEPVLVKGYSPFTLSAPETVPLHDADGTLAIQDTDAETIVAYQTALQQIQNQQQILRPAFFENFTDPRFGWKVPDKLPGVDVDMAELVGLAGAEGRRPMGGFELGPMGGRRGPMMEGGGRRGPMGGPDGPPPIGRGGAGRRQPAGEGGPNEKAPNVRVEITKLLKDAKSDRDNKKYLEAEEKLQSLLQYAQSGDLSKPQLDEVNSLRKEIQPNVEELLIKKQKEDRAAVATPNRMRDIEALWFNDVSVTPGQTYRYRLRLVVFNQYIGQAAKLADPQDAGKVVVRGQWSDWSEPIQVKPSLYLFLTSVADDGRKAKVMLREWLRGDLKGGTADKGIGELVTLKADRRDLSYDAILANVDPKRSVLLRRESGGKIGFTERPSGVAVLITAGGEVEERFAVLDAVKSAMLDKEYREEKERLNENDSAGPDRPEVGRPPRTGQPKAQDRRQPNDPGRSQRGRGM